VDLRCVRHGLRRAGGLDAGQPARGAADRDARRSDRQAQSGGAEPAPTLDTERAVDLERQANNRPTDAAVRIDLANLYYDARRFDLAVPWYDAALKLEPKNVNVSTDLALCYYATNDADKALKQIEYSLSIDPEARQDAAQSGHHSRVRQERSERGGGVVAEGHRDRADE
jgi:tetratricopeptide (TPR) repeat protein